jgi:ABC-type glycerol-3-phosphate transport system substrate-binding protein
MTRRRITAGSLLGLLAVLALVAAGCGGSSDKKANEAYANSVCSAVAAWEQQVKTIATTFSGPISKTTLDAKIAQVKTETKKLVSQIKAVPPPNTSDGKAAKQQLDQLSTQVNTTITNAQSAVSQIPANASAVEVASALIPLAPQVQSLATSAQTTLKSLQSAKGSLASAFKSTSSCKNLSLSG